MRYLICSDIHGSADRTEVLLSAMDKNQCEKMILLGDILYHGPRNPLPIGHNPQKVVELLNGRSSDIIACRGNCDAEVDQMVLEFPIMSDYSLVVDAGRKIFASHGHVWNPEHFPSLCKGDVFLFGHIHIQVLEKNANGIIICNPGSISLPKDSSPAGFAILDGNVITLFDIAGVEQKKLII